MIGIVLSLGAGILFGFSGLFPSTLEGFLERWIDVSLYVLVFGVGMELAWESKALEEIRSLGLRVFLLPLAAMVGSLSGAAFVALCSPMTLRECLAVASGFGWYSLSGVLLARLGNPSLGLFAFATNVFREILTLVNLEWVYRVFGGWAAVALGGATSMDTTLGVLSRVSGGKLVPLGVVSGVLHSLCVAPCVMFFSRFL
uniref:Lysine exporter LysO family protein n=1 Tax=Candidatus Caldatribacterium saccharofermentans TaxID=1454753 RepID=A0A7V4TEJ3_9BACT